MLYLIGLGLGGIKDISLKGLECVKKSDRVFLESYTSIFSGNLTTERFIKKMEFY